MQNYVVEFPSGSGQQAGVLQGSLQILWKGDLELWQQPQELLLT